jgi:hypothetical protein
MDILDACFHTRKIRMDKPSVTIELQNLLLSKIAQVGGTATTDDLLLMVEKWKEKA